MNEYELYHYGVKGMKWGVRKEARTARKQSYKTTEDRYKGSSKSFVQNRKQLRGREAYNRELLEKSVVGISDPNADAKTRAKNYQNSLNLANKNAALNLSKMHYDNDMLTQRAKQIEKLRNKPENDRRRKKNRNSYTRCEIVDFGHGGRFLSIH